MAPFHPLQYEARAFAARALAALAVFCTIAVVLLAGSTGDSIASAAAKDDNASNGNGQQAAEAPTPNGNGNGNGLGLGGAGKSDPADPQQPAEPPRSGEPVPASEPDPAPSGNTGGSGSGKDTGSDTPHQTGAGGKGNTADPDPATQGNTQAPAQPATPVTLDPVSAPPVTTIGSEADPGDGNRTRNRLRLQRGTASTAPVPDPGQVAGVGGTEAQFQPAPAAGAGAFERVGRARNGGDGSANPNDRRARPNEVRGTKQGPPIIREIPQFVDQVPPALKFALAVTGVLSILLACAGLVTTLRNRSLARQRRDLLQEVGLLQSALLPPVPDHVGGLRTSVAYRPADGPGAGGDFYDVLPLPGGRVGFILGDVSGHGRGALARTAFMRYTLRAYLEAGLEPRVALQVAGRVIDENLGGDFATVLLAVHDPETGSLTYATAGHPAPLVVGPQPHDPVTAGSSPPIGVGVRTGLRQTTVPLVPGSVAAMFTDGLLEARTEGGLLGRDRLEELLEELGDDATARGLVESVNKVARVMSDDIAAVVIQPTNAATAGLFRTEQLELTARELDSRIAERFLEACGVSDQEVQTAIYDARMIADRFGGVILHVVFGNRLRVEVLPRNVESIEAASRRAAAAR
ncbi:MAG TPA: SpoIIE family protein phosphatase [Thermoleophilaceae bacterium]|nr:SpoIIE family protein phosphatase [Thermoleophilaceae bacterium]